MEQMQLRAMAKINLGLDVVRKREDGYHEVRMVMQTVRMFDRVSIIRIRDEQIMLSSNLYFLPLNESNIAYKAANLMMETFGLPGGLHIDLQKRIPVAAGMAGGSADAAAVLYGINRMFGLDLSIEELMDLGLTLGADVPYCLIRGTALAEGIGERLTRLAPVPECYVLIVKPAISVSTKFVYENLHLEDNLSHPDIDGIIEAIENRDIHAMISCMGNTLETVTVPAYPIIGEIKQRMMDSGAMISLMSGSGPTVFGLFESYELVQRAKQDFFDWGGAPLVYVTEFYNV